MAGSYAVGERGMQGSDAMNLADLAMSSRFRSSSSEISLEQRAPLLDFLMISRRVAFRRLSERRRGTGDRHVLLHF